MDRRDFVTGVSALSLTAAASELAFARERAFDPTEQSMRCRPRWRPGR
jgi:hypothetical protein